MTAFSAGAYRGLLRSLHALGRQCIHFRDAASAGLLLRHDVDYSPERAAELAELNAELGVRATFFVLVDSPLYNLFSHASRGALATIARCGQDVALHARIDKNPTAEALRWQFELLRMAIPDAAAAIAWHNPAGDLSRLNALAGEAGLTSAYDPRWFGPGRYLSDSNLRHSPETLLHAARACSSPLLQVLVHPFNWLPGGDDMETILSHVCAERLGVIMSSMHENAIWRERARTLAPMALALLPDGKEGPHAGDG